MRRRKRYAGILVAFMMMLTVVPSGAFAEEVEENAAVENQEIEIDAAEITEIEGLNDSVSSQSIYVGSDKTPELPQSLNVKTVGYDEFIPAEVEWECNKGEFTSAAADTFIFTPVFLEKYILKEGVELPEITVEVVRRSTQVTGIAASITKKARGTVTDKITVTPAYGRTLKIQMYTGGKWVTKKTVTMAETESQTLTLKYPNDWWKVTSSKWRIYMQESSYGKSYMSPTVKITTRRYYQNPSKYVQIKDKITLKDSGGYNLSTGYMGLKVKAVNKYFGIGDKNWPRYTSTTKNKVKAFQKKKGLKATGVVNKATWLKMGFSESSWYNLGAYVTPVKVNPSSTKKQHIEAMISTALSYKGAPYVVGASGRTSQGADCSGLVMQALYSAGVDPYPVSVVRHSKPGYEYESRNLFSSSKFRKVAYKDKKRGDLIFYASSSGVVIHVGIYLGNGKIVHSWPNKVMVSSVKTGGWSRIAGVRRVFN